MHTLRSRHIGSRALLPQRWLLAGVMIASVSCSPALNSIPAPAPAEIPRLEAELARNGADASLMVRLGAAYRAAEQPDRARALLERALESDPPNPGAVLFLGLTYEDLGELARARALYQSYLEVGTSSRLKGRIEDRLALLQRREMELAIRAAVEQESRMSAGPPQPRTIAVFPFHFISRDTALEPLSRAMAAMLTTDLSQTDRLTVLERVQVQLLLDELQLGESGLVDAASAARSGRMLGAERVVQGSIGGGTTEVQLDAAVVRATPGSPPTGIALPPEAADQSGYVTHISESDGVRQLFEAEKRLALRIYEVVGVELTVAERERVNRRPTENLEALLAYGRGLRAADAGDFEQAARHFREATALDPAFTVALDEAVAADQLARASLESTGDLASAASFEALLPLALDALDVLVPSPFGRDAAQEVMGTEGYKRPTILELIIRRPSGDQ